MFIAIDQDGLPVAFHPDDQYQLIQELERREESKFIFWFDRQITPRVRGVFQGGSESKVHTMRLNRQWYNKYGMYDRIRAVAAGWLLPDEKPVFWSEHNSWCKVFYIYEVK